MFGLGVPEILVILVFALIFFGPEKLPEIAGQIGKTIRDFRRMTDEVTGEFTRTITFDEPPPPAALEPSPTFTNEIVEGTVAANGAGGNGVGDHHLIDQTIPSEVLTNTIPAEESWQAPGETTELAPVLPVATKADPLAGASLLDEQPATNGPVLDDGQAVIYRPASTLDDSAAAEQVVDGDVPQVLETIHSTANGTGTETTFATTAIPDGYAYHPGTYTDVPEFAPPTSTPVDPGAETTIREKIEAQVAAEAFRERRRVANYRRRRKAE